MKFNLKKYAKDKAEDFTYNPWAVCHTTVDKDEDPDKYERCVKKVKKKTRKKKKASIEKEAICEKGRDVSRMSRDALDNFLKNRGYTFFREEYPWGKTLSYRDADGTLFVLNGKLVDLEELKVNLRQTWVPRTTSDQAYYDENIGQA